MILTPKTTVFAVLDAVERAANTQGASCYHTEVTVARSGSYADISVANKDINFTDYLILDMSLDGEVTIISQIVTDDDTVTIHPGDEMEKVLKTFVAGLVSAFQQQETS